MWRPQKKSSGPYPRLPESTCSWPQAQTPGGCKKRQQSSFKNSLPSKSSLFAHSVPKWNYPCPFLSLTTKTLEGCNLRSLYLCSLWGWALYPDHCRAGSWVPPLRLNKACFHCQGHLNSHSSFLSTNWVLTFIKSLCKKHLSLKVFSGQQHLLEPITLVL